jgi:hypothetical protein
LGIEIEDRRKRRGIMIQAKDATRKAHEKLDELCANYLQEIDSLIQKAMKKGEVRAKYTIVNQPKSNVYTLVEYIELYLKKAGYYVSVSENEEKYYIYIIWKENI